VATTLESSAESSAMTSMYRGAGSRVSTLGYRVLSPDQDSAVHLADTTYSSQLILGEIIQGLPA
jgi:hypothetical protein